MIHDTSSFKGIRMQRKDLVSDIATERVLANREDATATTHDFEFKMRQVVIQQLVLHTMNRGTCLERVMETVMDYLECPLPWHRDQAHLAEWQALNELSAFFSVTPWVSANPDFRLPDGLNIRIPGHPSPAIIESVMGRF